MDFDLCQLHVDNVEDGDGALRWCSPVCLGISFENKKTIMQKSLTLFVYVCLGINVIITEKDKV
jgi:hypothetical protein